MARGRSKEHQPLTIQARISAEHHEYLQRLVDGEHAKTLSEALRDAIVKARILDEQLSAGNLNHLIFNPDEHELVEEPSSPADEAGRD